MSKLATLKLLAEAAPQKGTPEMVRRTKMVRKLSEQRLLALSMYSGESFSPTVKRKVHDPETDALTVVEVPKRIRPWWFTTASGKTALTLRYGSQLIELAKGKFSIEVSDNTKLAETLETISQAVLAGELDPQISASATLVRKRFSR